MIQNLETWLIQHYGHEVAMPGLERISSYLAPYKKKFQEKKITTIAGTNGKGEVTHRLADKLSSFCAWTSPHIDSVTERFRSHEGDISIDELERFVLLAHELVLFKKIKLTYYEFLFLVFCLWTDSKNPDFLLLEVGLGGRLDAVNFFDADLVLLPSISRDHQEILGNRYEKILAEKLGVVRPDSHLISFLDLNYLNERIGYRQKIMGFSWLELQKMTTDDVKSHFNFRNEVLAEAGASFLKGVSLQVHKNQFSVDKLKFRGEVFRGKYNYHFYGSHNPDGMRKLIQILNNEEYTKESRKLMIVAFSKRSEKDLLAMMKMLNCLKQMTIILTSFDHPKAADPEVVKSLAKMKGLNFVSDIEKEFETHKPTDIYLCGSYYFMSSFRKNYCR